MERPNIVEIEGYLPDDGDDKVVDKSTKIKLYKECIVESYRTTGVRIDDKLGIPKEMEYDVQSYLDREAIFNVTLRRNNTEEDGLYYIIINDTSMFHFKGKAKAKDALNKILFWRFGGDKYLGMQSLFSGGNLSK